MQTGNTVRQADARANAALVGLTRDAALAEREVIQRAFGMPIRSAPLAVRRWDDRSRSENSQASVAANQHMAISVGARRPDGEMWCASNGMRYDFSEFQGRDEIAADPRPTVQVNANGSISGRPVVVITQPFDCDGPFAGFVFVSVPHERLELQDGELSDENLTVITFNAGREFLTATGRDAEDPKAVLPQSRPLETLLGGGIWAFSDRTASGEVRNFAAPPIFADTVYVLGT